MKAERVLLALVAALCLSGRLAWAEKKYDPGASDTEIKIGQTYPYSVIASGASRWGDYKGSPWTMGWIPTIRGGKTIPRCSNTSGS